MLADHVACIVKALISSPQTPEADVLESANNVVEQRRRIVALREYAYGEIDSEVIGEMWVVEEALLDAGRFEERKL